MATIAKQIRYFRHRNKWTQEQLADYLNIARSSISKWETGRSEPDLVSLVRLAEVFEISTDLLLNGQFSKQQFVEEWKKVYRLKVDAHFIELAEQLLRAPDLLATLESLLELDVMEQERIIWSLQSLVRGSKGGG